MKSRPYSDDLNARNKHVPSLHDDAGIIVIISTTTNDIPISADRVLAPFHVIGVADKTFKSNVADATSAHSADSRRTLHLAASGRPFG